MKFSVIIPVYNCENYISRCVSSVIEQVYTNFEIILVDDGSTDKSLEICEHWAKLDKRIKVIKQKNQGPGVARNQGIKKATGEYIVFIDSDDYVDVDYFERVHNYIKKYETDIVFIGFQFEEQLSQRKIAEVKMEEGYYDKREFHTIIKTLIDNDMFGYTWCKISKRKLLLEHNLKFEKKFSLHEDLLLACDMCEVAESIGILNITSYHYIKGEDTLCTKFRSDIMENMEYINGRVFDFYQNIKIDNLDEMIIKRAVFSMFLIMKNSIAETGNIIDKKAYKNFMRGRTIKEIRLRKKQYSKAVEGKKKWIFYVIVYFKSPFFFKLIVDLYKKINLEK